MEPHTRTHKRSKCGNQEDEPASKAKKCSSDIEQAHNTGLIQRSSCGDPSRPQDQIIPGDLNKYADLSQLISVWSDAQIMRNKALSFPQSTETIVDILLNDSVNKKFLEFHHDITEECGADDKQHSWAVIEKKEEVVMYGPYYPNYNKKEHSEDIVIRQTEELLASSKGAEDWEVYVFTMNSPCLCRDVKAPCMLKLVQKAQEWWLKFRVKTNVGYKRCWGFKGSKETTFRVINYSQVQAVQNCVHYEEYVSQNLTAVDLLGPKIFTLLKNMLKSGPLRFELSLQGLEWHSYFKGMQFIQESVHGIDKALVRDDICRMTEDANRLSSKKSLGLEEHVVRGHEFASGFGFNSLMTEGTKNDIIFAFQKCWREMIQDKYTEEIREALTEDFNKRINQLFITDFADVTSPFLLIGMVHSGEKVGSEN